MCFLFLQTLNNKSPLCIVIDTVMDLMKEYLYFLSAVMYFRNDKATINIPTKVRFP